MKLIKDKKLFGILNALDIAIIAFILVLILPMLHYYLRFNEKGVLEQMLLEKYLNRQRSSAMVTKIGHQTLFVEINVSFKNLTKEEADKIKAGDEERLPDGTVIAKVLAVGKPEPNYFLVDLGYEKLKKAFSENGLYSLPARLKIQGYVIDNAVFNYKTKEFKRDCFSNFNCGRYEVEFAMDALPGDLGDIEKGFKNVR